jgi:hypothetical protein
LPAGTELDDRRPERRSSPSTRWRSSASTVASLRTCARQWRPVLRSARKPTVPGTPTPMTISL